MPDPKTKGLVYKLAEVMGAVGPVAKAGFNKAQSYNYAKESDVAEAVRPLLAERHIWIWSDTVTSSMEPLYQTSSGATMWLTKVVMAYRFIDGETGEMTEIQHYEGQGADSGDKSLPKAQSMSLKYFLLKSFAMSTGVDDAEADEKVDRAAAAAGAVSGPKVVKGTTPGVQRGGKSDGVTAAQAAEIAKNVKALGLDAQGFAAMSTAIIGKGPSEGQGGKAFLESLSSEEAGKLISGLIDFVPHVPDVPAAGESEQEALSLV